MFQFTVARIENPNGDKRYLGMINVEIYDDNSYCEYVIDGGVIVWQSNESSEEMDVAAFDTALKFEATE